MTKTQTAQGAVGIEPLAGSYNINAVHRPGVTVEFGFGYGVTVAASEWVDVTGYVRSIDIRRGRSDDLNRVEAGSAAVVLDNRDARFDPSNTAGPYYADLKPLVQVRIRANWLGVTYGLFYGYVEAYQLGYVKGPLAHSGDAITTIRAVDGFKPLALRVINASIASAKTVAQIIVGLDEAAWPSTLRDLPDSTFGSYTLAASTLTNASALGFLQNVTEAEGGILYMNADGEVTFKLQNYTGQTFDEASRTWGDGGGTELPYRDLTFDYSDFYIYNDIRIARSGGAEQSASDGTSQDAYGVRSLVQSGTLHNADASCLDLALILVARYKDPFVRAPRIEMTGQSNPDAWPQILSTDITSKLIVRRRPPPTGELTELESVVQGISHTITPDFWTNSFNLSQFVAV